MKKNIHPKYFDNATVACSCGAVLKTGSTQEKLTVEICSQCHPFYTGKKKVVDTAGRVDRFKRLTERATEKRDNIEKAKETKKVEKKTEVKKKEVKKKEIKKIAKKKK